MAGPNDIQAAFILRDDTSAILKKIDDNTKKTSDSMQKSVGKTQSVFDKFNFSVNVGALAMKGFKTIAKSNEQVQDDLSTSLEWLTNVLSSAAKLFIDAAGGAGRFRDVLRDMEKSNADEKVRKAAEQAERLLDKMTFPGKSGPLMEILKGQGIEGDEALKRVWKALDTTAESLKKTGEQAKIVAQLMDVGLTKTVAESLVKNLNIAKEEVKETKEEVVEFKDALKDVREEAEKIEMQFRRTFGGGFRREVESASSELFDLGNIGTRTARDMQSAFSNTFFSAMRREFTSMKDFGLSMLDALLQGFQRQIADFVASGILSMIGGLFSGPSFGIGAALKGTNLPAFGGLPSDNPYTSGNGFIPSASDFGGIGSAGEAQGYQSAGGNYTINISAVDARSFAQLAAANPGAIVGPVQAALGRNRSLRKTVAGL